MKSVLLPSINDLQMAYEHLGLASKKAVRLEELILWSHWSRLDPRLAELLVLFFEQKFQSINPFKLSKLNLISPTPQALATLLEFTQQRIDLARHSKLFELWKSIVNFEVKPATPQMFFAPQGRPDAAKLTEEILHAVGCSKKYGLLTKEWIGKPKTKQQSVLKKTERDNILNELMQKKSTFTVKDYILACNHSIHPRMAERDLANCKKLRPIGRTRSRKYTVNAKS